MTIMDEEIWILGCYYDDEINDKMVIIKKPSYIERQDLQINFPLNYDQILLIPLSKLRQDKILNINNILKYLQEKNHNNDSFYAIIQEKIGNTTVLVEKTYNQSMPLNIIEDIIKVKKKENLSDNLNNLQILDCKDFIQMNINKRIWLLGRDVYWKIEGNLEELYIFKIPSDREMEEKRILNFSPSSIIGVKDDDDTFKNMEHHFRTSPDWYTIYEIFLKNINNFEIKDSNIKVDPITRHFIDYYIQVWWKWNITPFYKKFKVIWLLQIKEKLNNVGDIISDTMCYCIIPTKEEVKRGSIIMNTLNINNDKEDILRRIRFLHGDFIKNITSSKSINNEQLTAYDILIKDDDELLKNNIFKQCVFAFYPTENKLDSVHIKCENEFEPIDNIIPFIKNSVIKIVENQKYISDDELVEYDKDISVNYISRRIHDNQVVYNCFKMDQRGMQFMMKGIIYDTYIKIIKLVHPSSQFYTDTVVNVNLLKRNLRRCLEQGETL